MSNDKGTQCVSLYFYENGNVSSPERVRKRRTEVEKIIVKKGKFYSYQAKTLHSFRGEPICIFDASSLPQMTGYVLVAPGEKFSPRNYQDAFQGLMAERKAQRTMSKSMPAVISENDFSPPKSKPAPFHPEPEPCTPTRPPSSLLPTSEGSDIESRVTTPAACGQNPCAKTRRNNFEMRRSTCDRSCPRPPRNNCPPVIPGCQLEGSDGCDECPRVPQINYKCKSRRAPTPMVLRERTGFMAKCCPCCVSKYECTKENARPPTAGCSPNAKLTQTDKKDFAVAKKQLQKAINEERARQKQYKTKRVVKPCAQKKSICPGDDDECEDPKTMMKREQAREKYCLKRRKMEQKLTKALEKQYRRCPK